MGQIVVVEEDGAAFQQFKQCVESKGHLVWHFNNTSEAQSFLKQYDPALIVCAVHLQNDDVFKFLSSVKENSATEKIPFVFYCAEPDRFNEFATPELVKKGKILGARKYILLTQFNANALLEQLNDCLGDAATKRDTLGGQVKTYSLSDLA